jgi:hypothetical protein
MRLNIGDTPPSYDGSWQITHLGRRAKWDSGHADCEQCGTTVPLSAVHSYARVERRPPTGRSSAREDIVFCSPTCLEAWGST